MHRIANLQAILSLKAGSLTHKHSSDSSQHLTIDFTTHLMQGPRVLLEYFEPSNAGPYNENSLLGVPSEVNTGENIGQGEKVNVCKFPLGSVNNWEVHHSSL